MPAISYTVGDRTFPTQQELVSYVQTILRSSRAPVQLVGEHAAVMSDLLLRHPRADLKVGSGVAAIWVRRNGVFGNGFFVERTDGTLIDFSYKQCIRPQNHATKAKFAFRRAIDGQVLAVKTAAFAENELLRCPINGELIMWTTAHVDHEPPRTFAALLTAYCAERGIDLDTIELYEPSNGIGKLLSPDIEADWAAWHETRAVLRVISAEANTRLVR
jgi:hypothetical protein